MEPFEQPFAHGIYKQKYAHEGEEWPDTAERVAGCVMGALYYTPNGEKNASLITNAQERVRVLIDQRHFIPGGRYLAASGRELHQTQNCLLLRAEDTREGWAELSYKAEMATMTGAGIGVVYSGLRSSGTPLKRTGGIASGPIAKMKSVNEIGRGAQSGGNRRAAIWAGLHWWHPDVFDFIRAKDWPEWLREQKDLDPTTPAPLDMTNVSVILDDTFFWAYNSYESGEHLSTGLGECPDDRGWHQWAKDVYAKTLDKMLTTAEPGFSVDFENPDECLRNACTEVTSADDSDICNLGSLNMASFATKEQFSSAVKDATLFLLAGTVYSHVPYKKVEEVRDKNRRLGLGVMGIHEWLLKRGKRYGPDEELGEWLDEYARATEFAHQWADRFGLSRPVATRAIAPTGTIGILAETTTGIEPIFAAAFKRTLYNAGAKGTSVQYEYVVDPTAKRLVDAGVDPSVIEDAHELSYDVERRIEMQAWVQQYVDQGISSTINLPEVVHNPAEQADFGRTLYKYLPKLRGVTCYPDGVRAGQPIEAAPLEYALEQQGVRLEAEEAVCVGGACGV